MKLIRKEEVKKNHNKDILGLDLLLAENFPPYGRFLEKCLNTQKYIMYVCICSYVHTKGG